MIEQKTKSRAGKRPAMYDRHEGQLFVMRCCHRLERFCDCPANAVATCPICNRAEDGCECTFTG